MEFLLTWPLHCCVNVSGQKLLSLGTLCTVFTKKKCSVTLRPGMWVILGLINSTSKSQLKGGRGHLQVVPVSPVCI